jgi:hypothetical protein
MNLVERSVTLRSYEEMSQCNYERDNLRSLLVSIHTGPSVCGV